MRWTSALPAAALLALWPLLSVAAAPRTITKSSIRADPPGRTHGRLRDVVWDMFVQEDMRRSEPPRRPLTDLWLRTKMRGTMVPSLCRYDSAHVEFARLHRWQDDADAKVRAVGLTAQSFFHFLAPPAGDHASVVDYQRSPGEADCRSLEDRKDSFFAAPGEEIATDGYRAFLNLQQAIRDGWNSALECDLYPRETQSCSELILSFGQNDLRSIERCDAPAAGTLCFRLDVAERQMKISVTSGYHPSAAFGEIISARLDTLIIMSHERID